MSKFEIGAYVFTYKPTVIMDNEPDWRDHMDKYNGKEGQIISKDEHIYKGQTVTWYRIVHKTDPSEISWNFAERWLKSTVKSYHKSSTFNYCPVCGSKGFTGFNLFACQNISCVNYKE